MSKYFNLTLAKNVITMLVVVGVILGVYGAGSWVYNTYRDFDAMRGYIITQVQKDKAAAARKPAENAPAPQQ